MVTRTKVRRAFLLQVVKALHKPSGQIRALKRVFNRNPQVGLSANRLREYQSLRTLDHRNIVRLLDTFSQVRAAWDIGQSVCKGLDVCLPAIGQQFGASTRVLLH